jgi:hypothetical protein
LFKCPDNCIGYRYNFENAIGIIRFDLSFEMLISALIKSWESQMNLTIKEKKKLKKYYSLE